MKLLRSILRSGCLAAALAAAPSAQAYEVEADVVWRVPLEHAGKSSPRSADLNGDDFPDVLVGRGVEHLWGEVAALDGKSGRELWTRRFPDEVLLTLPLLDVDADGIRDVFVGGRVKIRDVYALSGKSGEVLWRLTTSNPTVEFPPINFINLLLVEDRDGDGRDDLLVVQSGGQDALRLAARLHWVRSRDGRLFETRIAPDGKESYAIPIYEARGDAPARIYVGTGGETLSGSLLRLEPPGWTTAWSVPSIGGGFIGSPTLTDLDGDGRDEVIAAGMNGATYRIDAEDGSVAWRLLERPFWTYVSPAVGSFGGDTTLDVVSGFNRGTWPRHDRSRWVWIDGASGRILGERSFEGTSQSTAASPLVLDVDHDGRDETLVVLSNPVPDGSVSSETHSLRLFDGADDREEKLRIDLDGYSIATPHLSDPDDDGRIDVIHASHFEVIRFELTISEPSPQDGKPQLPRVRRGALRGPNALGVYRP